MDEKKQGKDARSKLLKLQKGRSDRKYLVRKLVIGNEKVWDQIFSTLDAYITQPNAADTPTIIHLNIMQLPTLRSIKKQQLPRIGMVAGVYRCVCVELMKIKKCHKPTLRESLHSTVGLSESEGPRRHNPRSLRVGGTLPWSAWYCCTVVKAIIMAASGKRVKSWG